MIKSLVMSFFLVFSDFYHFGGFFRFWKFLFFGSNFASFERHDLPNRFIGIEIS